MKNIYWLILLLLINVSCGRKGKINTGSQIDTTTSYYHLNQEVMQIHDDAMRQSSYVLKLKSKINDLIKTNSAIETKDSLLSISALLYKADKTMLEWMHQYKEPKNINDTAALNYLLKQKKLILEVHKTTFEAINKAENVLQKIK